MDKQNDIIPSIVSIAYTWMGEQNKQAAESVVGLLEQLQLNIPMKKKVDDLAHDFKVFFHLPDSYKIQWHVEIPQDKNEDQKLMWAAGVCIMNLFKLGDFAMGYTMLMVMTADWNELYVSVIKTLQKEAAIKNELAEWLMTHFFVACDLLGTKEIEMMGYKVEKQ